MDYFCQLNFSNLEKLSFKTFFFFLEVLNDNENLKKLKAENFDLAITEIFESCGLGVIKKLGIKKYITTYASALFPKVSLLLGVQLHPSYIPGMTRNTIILQHTKKIKFRNVIKKH